MTFWQGTILLLTTLVVGGLSFWQNRGRATKKWSSVLKAGGYLFGAALLLVATPSADALSGWGTLVCWIIAVLCVLIVFEYTPPETILRNHQYDWQNGQDRYGDDRGGLKLLYRVVKVADRIDAFIWKKKRKLPRIRFARRVVFVVLVGLVVLSWGLPLIVGLFASDDPPAMGMGASAETTQSQSEPPSTEVAPATTTPSAATTTATTTASASAESLDQSCAGPQSSDLRAERTENVKFGVKEDLWVCRDGGQWLAWKEGTAPATVTILSWTKAVAPEDKLTYVYAVIEANAKQYYVKSVPKE